MWKLYFSEYYSRQGLCLVQSPGFNFLHFAFKDKNDVSFPIPTPADAGWLLLVVGCDCDCIKTPCTARMQVLPPYRQHKIGLLSLDLKKNQFVCVCDCNGTSE